MRATWNGYLRLGTLSVPVKLYAATRAVGPHFVQLHAKDHAPITRQTICQLDGEEVVYKDIVRAVEHEGTYVELSEDDLQLDGENEKALQIRQFSDSFDIDPFFYEKPFYVVPGEGGEFAYALLRQAFVKAKKIAIATYVYYDKQHLGIISVVDGIIRLQQLRYVDEVIAPKELPSRSLPQPAPGQVDTAVQLMERYSTAFYIGDYSNEQVDMLNKLVERRAKGHATLPRSRKAVEATAEHDIMPTIKDILNEKNQHVLEG